MNLFRLVQINWHYLVETSLEELDIEQDRLYNLTYRPLWNFRLGIFARRFIVSGQIFLTQTFPFFSD